MADTPAITGHDALLYANTVGAPTVFTAIAQVTGDINYSVKRDSTPAPIHGLHSDQHVFSPLLNRDPLVINCNFVFGSTSHTKLKLAAWNNTTLGYILCGPGGTPGDGLDSEYLVSGNITAFEEKNPIAGGIRTAMFTMQPSGAQKIDGVLYP